MAVRARRAEQSAILERDTAKAVSDFLQKDLLAQGNNEEQAARHQSGSGFKSPYRDRSGGSTYRWQVHVTAIGVRQAC
jgi:hypothetical protein